MILPRSYQYFPRNNDFSSYWQDVSTFGIDVKISRCMLFQFTGNDFVKCSVGEELGVNKKIFLRYDEILNDIAENNQLSVYILRPSESTSNFDRTSTASGFKESLNCCFIILHVFCPLVCINSQFSYFIYFLTIPSVFTTANNQSHPLVTIEINAMRLLTKCFNVKRGYSDNSFQPAQQIFCDNCTGSNINRDR